MGVASPASTLFLQDHLGKESRDKNSLADANCGEPKVPQNAGW